MEGNSTPAPDDQLEPGTTGTPDLPESAAQPAPAAGADQSAAESDSRIAQAEYTRSQQTIAAIRQELGLDRKATREQVLEALRERTAARADDVESEPQEELDPRIVAAEERAFLAELRVQEAVYAPIFGQGFTTRALELANTLRTTNDPEELMTAVAAFIESSRQSAAPPDEPPAPGESSEPVTPPDAGLPEGDQGPSARPSPSAGRRESGVVGAVRGIFANAGAASRQ